MLFFLFFFFCFFFPSCEDVIRYLCAWEVNSVMCDSLRPYGLYSPPGSSVHRILQARILESVAMTSFRGSSQPVDCTSSAAPAWQADSLPLNHGGCGVEVGSLFDYLHALYILHLNPGVWQLFNTCMWLHFLIIHEPEKVKWLQSSPTPEKSQRVLSGKKDIIINFLVVLIWAHRFFEMPDNLNARDLQNSTSLFILMKESFLEFRFFQCQI